VGVVLVGSIILSRIDLQQIYSIVAAHQPALLDIFMPVALLSLFNNMFFGFGEVFHNNVWWSRAFAIRSTVTYRAFFIAGLLWLPIPVAAGFIGLCAVPLGINIPDADMVGPLVASALLGHAGSMLVFVVVFCSLASSIDSLLAATSDLLVEDVFRKMFCLTTDPAQLHRISKWVVVGLGLLTWGLCLPRLGNLIEVLFISGPMVASAIWPVAAGLYWKRVNRRGAFWAMVLGSSIGLLSYFGLGWYTASLVSAAVSAAVLVVSTVTSPGNFQWDGLREAEAS
jgi:Na+/proline symporter